jgi:hypothetical protein
MILHCADLANPARPRDQAIIWAKMISMEFTNQVKLEKELGLPVTEYMQGLEKERILLGQEFGFANFVVKPLWVAMNRMVEGQVQNFVDTLESNVAFYKAESERLKKLEEDLEESEKK